MTRRAGEGRWPRGMAPAVAAFLISAGALWWWMPARPAFALPGGEALLGFAAKGRAVMSVARRRGEGRSVFYDGPIRLRDLATGRPAGEVAGGERGLTRIVVSPDGSKVATRGGPNVRLWDVATGRRLAEFPSFDIEPVASGPEYVGSCFSPDGGLFAYLVPREKEGDWPPSRAIAVWDVAADRRRALVEDIDYFCPFAFSPDGRTLAVSAKAEEPLVQVDRRPSRPAVARLVDLDTGAEMAPLRAHSSGHEDLYVFGLSFSRDGRTLISGTNALTRMGHTFDAPAEVRLWDVATGKERAAIATGQYDGVLGGSLSADGRFLLARYGGRLSSKTFGLFDLSAAPPRKVRDLNGAADLEPGRGIVAFSDAIAVTARGFGSPDPGADRRREAVSLLEPGRPGAIELARFDVTMGGIPSLGFSPDGRTLAVGVSSWSDGSGGVPRMDLLDRSRVQLYDVATHRAGAWFPAADDGRFAPDGSAFLTIREDGPITVCPLPARPDPAVLFAGSALAAVAAVIASRACGLLRARRARRVAVA